MVTNIQILNEVLKLDYQDSVRDVLNSAVILNKRLERDYDSVQGEQVYFAVNKSRNNSFSGVKSGEVLPAHGAQGYAASLFSVPEHYGRIKVSEKQLQASRNSKGAMIRILESEMKHLVRDGKVSLNRMNYADGSGILAKIEVDGGNDLTVFVEHTGSAANGTRETYFQTRFMEVGMIVGFTADKVTQTGAGTAITAINRATRVVTVADGATADANDYICIFNALASEQMGLLGIVDDGTAANAAQRFLTTFQSIDRSAAGNEYWSANRLGTTPATLRNLTLDLLQTAQDEAETQGDGSISLWLTTYGIRREYANLLIQDRRYVTPTEKVLDGGFRALLFNDIPLIPDRHAPKYKIFGLDEPTIKFAMMSDMEWMERDGSVLSRVANRPEYEATMFLYRQMYCTDPKNNVLLDNINDPTTLV